MCGRMTWARERPERLWKKWGMKNCESFCCLARRKEEAGFPPATGAQRIQRTKGPQPDLAPEPPQ